MNILKYGEGVAFLESNDNILGLELDITSQMQSESLLGEGFLFSGNKNKIIIASLNNKPLDNKELFKYNGVLKINSVIAGVMLNGKAVKVSVSAQSSEVEMLINNSNTLVNSSNISMDINENIPASPVNVNKQLVCVTNNLSTEGGEFYFKNGVEYLGDYHLYGNLKAMTGATRSDSSEFIYRKDALDKLEQQNIREEFEIKPVVQELKLEDLGDTEETKTKDMKGKFIKTAIVKVKDKVKPQKSVIKGLESKQVVKKDIKGGKY